MTLKWHMVSQGLLFVMQGLNMLTTTVSPKWQPVVMGGLSLCQIGLAYVAHHFTPDGQKL